MSFKRSLSPESNHNNNNIHILKRLKLHSIIEELRNEEDNLVLLKKLYTSQQLSTRTNKNSKTTIPITNNFPSPPTTNILPSTKSSSLPTINSSIQQQSIRKLSNSPLLTNHSLEERKTQAKLSLRKQLENDLLNIPSPKPYLQNIIFIPNLINLEFQPLIGLEDIIQCLNELQNHLPQHFTNHIKINEPYICDQCNTDFTICWWKHINNNFSNKRINILCDRCKKQIIRKTLKSEHSILLKNVFISAMKQEKEIEKHFNIINKQEKNSSQLLSKSLKINNPHLYQIIKTKQNFSKKISTQKSNIILQSKINNHSTIKHENHFQSVQHNKTSMSTHHHHQQQNYHSKTVSLQKTKNNQIAKISKIAIRQQQPIISSNTDFIHSLLLSSNVIRPTTTKRRTFPLPLK